MKNSINILVALLVVQGALAVFLLTRSEPTATFTAQEALLQLGEGSVDKIVVESKTGEKLEKLELHKKEEVWRVSNYFDFPASDAKIREFLATMTGFKKSWPVGKTKIAAKQFRVVEEDFERRLSFYSGEKKLSTLFIGSSPSFKKVHARVNEEDFTYSVAFNAYEASLQSKEWINKSLLDQERAKVTGIQFPSISLKNVGGDFTLAELPKDKEMDRTKVNPVVSKAIGLGFDEVLGKKSEQKHGEEVYKYTVSLGDEKIDFVFYAALQAPKEADKDKKGDDAGKEEGNKDPDLVLLSSATPFAYSIKKSRIESLLNLEAANLLKDKEPEEKKATDGKKDTNQGASASSQSSSNLDAQQTGGLKVGKDSVAKQQDT